MDVFFCADDRQEYLDLLSQSASQPALACCLMSNHADFVVVPREERPLARTFGQAHRRYTRMVNFREGVAGSSVAGAFSILIRCPHGGPVQIYGLSFLRGPCLSDNRSALCGVCVRLKPKDRRIFSPYNLGH